MIDKKFITAGRAIFTLELPNEFAADKDIKPHYTFRVRKSKATDKWPEAYWVNLLTGPDNTADYMPIGKLDVDTGAVALTKNTKFTLDSWPVRLLQRTLARVWADEADKVAAAGFKLHHEGRCCRCGRLLTVPESIESGVGPECAGKL